MYKLTRLKNGIRVISENVPYVRSVSVGVWIGNGSRYETKEENGMSHFIEHMLFKGTKKRDAKMLAYEIESVGGQINAFTTKEYTCYQTKTLDEHAPIALDVLSDMLFSSKLTQEHIELERGVIGEEINMYEDDPEELCADLLDMAAFGDSPLGRPVLGTKESILNISSETMREFLKTHYTAENTVISVSGHFDDNIFILLEKYFGEKSIMRNAPKYEKCIYLPKRNMVKEKDFEQVQIMAGFKSIDIKDERVYSLLVFNNVFGGGTSSRLFQKIREEKGLAYSVYAYHTAYMEAGLFSVCAAMAPENTKKVCSLICDEIKLIKDKGLDDDELKTAKNQLKGSYLLSYESVEERMQAAGRNLLLDRPMISPEEVIEKINSVSKNDIADICDTILDEKTLCVAAAGPIDSADGLIVI